MRESVGRSGRGPGPNLGVAGGAVGGRPWLQRSGHPAPLGEETARARRGERGKEEGVRDGR